MKKFRALWLAMALVAVVAFASVASAATFVGLNKSGTFGTLTIDLSDSGTPLSTKGTITGAPAMTKNSSTFIKLFGRGGKIFAVSADKTATTTAPDKDSVVIFQQNSSTGKLELASQVPFQYMTFGTCGFGLAPYKVTDTLRSLAGVKDVIVSGDTAIFVAESALSALVGTTPVSFDLSVDVAFVANSKLYVMNSNNPTKGTTHISEVAEIKTTTEFTSVDICDVKLSGEGAKKKSYELKGTNITWKPAPPAGTTGKDYFGAVHTAQANDYVYIATETGLYKTAITETGIIHTPEIKKVVSGQYLAMTSNGEDLYLVKINPGNVAIIEQISTTDDTKTNQLCGTLASDLSIAADSSVDIYYDPSDKVIGVVNHGEGLGVYTLDTESNKYKFFYKDGDFNSAAMFVTASGSSTDDGDSKTDTSTIVDASKITDTTEVANLKESTGGDTKDFVTTATEKTGTTPSDTVKAAVQKAAGTGFENATVAAVTDYTIADGYILVKAAHNAANVKVFFVEKASTTAAAGDAHEAVLLDSAYKTITKGTSVYAASTEKLSAGDYTLVTATKASSSTDTDSDTTTTSSGSSSSGCDMGLGLWSLAALMAVTTLSKRR